MSEMASENENPSLNSVQHTLDCSEPVGAALGSSQALSSICTLPPIQTITEAVPNDPSPLTTSATTADSETFQRSVSARRVEYDVTDDGVVISVPVTSDIPYSNNNNGTYEDGYDSNGQLGPFYDAVCNEKDDDDEEFIEEEQRPLNEVSNDSVQQESHEIAPEANLPNFQLMTVAQLKDELRKRNLPVHGRYCSALVPLLLPSTIPLTLVEDYRNNQPILSMDLLLMQSGLNLSTTKRELLSLISNTRV
jgi:hypothetical protein